MTEENDSPISKRKIVLTVLSFIGFNILFGSIIHSFYPVKIRSTEKPIRGDSAGGLEKSLEPQINVNGSVPYSDNSYSPNEPFSGKY